MIIPRLLPFVAFAAAASFFNPLGGNQDSQLRLQGDGDEPVVVPGDNPLEFCQPPVDYLLEIDNVDLAPNPPKAYVFATSVCLFVCCCGGEGSFARHHHNLSHSHTHTLTNKTVLTIHIV
jgi:hypothetical protein